MVLFAWQGATIKEASGVVRAGDWLLIADDSDVGGYFRVSIGKLFLVRAETLSTYGD